MNICQRCGGQFPSQTSGIAPGVKTCLSAAQCDANLAAIHGDAPIFDELRPGYHVWDRCPCADCAEFRADFERIHNAR